MNYTLLEFDTKISGFKVAKILSPRLSLVELKTTINKLREQNVKLIFWPADSADEISNQAALRLGGFLGSKQITYLLDLRRLKLVAINDDGIAEYKEKTASPELEKLALLAGTYSHFKTDPNFSEEIFHKLYHAWIENSVNRSIANKIIVIRHENKIVAMITLGEKNNRGDIGLLAVDPNFRGKNFGTKLVRAAQAYFIEAGFYIAQVVTQKANIPACSLYEKCDFHKEKIENFYHFWL